MNIETDVSKVVEATELILPMIKAANQDDLTIKMRRSSGVAATRAYSLL